MSFELRDRDLQGRIGRLKTKSGTIETPAFMPVINPVKQKISPKRMKNEFGCEIIITNSYIIKNHFGNIPDLKIHNLLEYDGVIATDSGAYQILLYGEIEVTQEEIINFQKKIESDISVILDIPTGWDVPRSQVEFTVEETLKRASEAIPLIKDSSALWVGPIQGGKHLDLVARSARKIGNMPFHIHALGSPTEVMERYMFPVLVEMIMTAKKNMPIERPLHLFGAGHPMMLPLSVAMGCDLFDSAAYAIYAKDERYLTNRGTRQLKDLNYLPCSCPICRKHSAEELKEMIKGERQRQLTEHNLHVTMTEIEIIKQAIVEGTLWDLVEARAKGHSQMTSAMKRLTLYKEELEKKSPGFKGHGVFYHDYNSLAKPEITRHIRLLEKNYKKQQGTDILLLLARPRTRPFSSHPSYIKFRKKINSLKETRRIHVCFYAAPYGIVPEALNETYPLSQFEIALPLDHETIEFTVKQIMRYISSTNYKYIFQLSDKNLLEERLAENLNQVSEEKKIKITRYKSQDPWNSTAPDEFFKILKNIIG
jgi:7-cyano-7-deazaguanine tRNA-ribosyltransferase